MATAHVLTLDPRHATSDHERRREDRHELRATAVLRVLVPLSTAPEPVRLIDISTHGVRIQTNRPLYVHSSVMVRFAQTTLMGEVRYCREAASGFEVGVEICMVYDPVSKEGEIVRG